LNFYAGINLGCSKKGIKMSDHYENDDSPLVGELDLSFSIDEEKKVQDHVDDNLARNGEFNVDMNQHEKLGPPSLPADFANDISKPSHEKSYPVPDEFDHDDVGSTQFDYDHERIQSPLKNNHYQGEMDELHGSNFLNSSHLKAQTFSNKGTEGSAHSQESPLLAEGNRGEQMERDSDLGMPSVYNEIEGEGSDTVHLLSSPRSLWCKNEPKNGNFYNPINSQTENTKPDMLHSGMQSPMRTPKRSISSVMERQMPVSPKRSPCIHQSPSGHKPLSSQQVFQDPSYSPRSQRQKHSSPKRKGLNKGLPSQDQISPARKVSISPPRSRHKDDSSRKGISASRKTSYSPSFDRRRDRSVSRLPIRQRDYKRKHHDRSRSRSPYSSAHYRSPR
jgi:hypothetical protein